MGDVVDAEQSVAEDLLAGEEVTQVGAAEVAAADAIAVRVDRAQVVAVLDRKSVV